MNPQATKPSIPDHEVLRVIGRGAYGEIWLARGLTGTLRAVKVVYRETFESERSFNREFEGMSSFEPISRTHEGFVDILHVGRAETFFYYIMELADDCEQGQHIDAQHYKPKTLKSELERQKRIPADECVEIGLRLTEALRALHARLLAHRDIKPANIIFVHGVPKLADIGLVAVSGQRSFVGTEGYVPPEGPGTPQADIYSLGKVLYEISMGKDRLEFPEVSTSLEELPDKGRLMRLNRVLLKACANDPERRYENAERMHEDLAELNGVKQPKRSGWLRVPAALALLLAAGALAAWHFSPKYTTGVPATAFIRTEPPDAMVLLDDRGGRSPMEFTGVESGTHHLHVMLPDYDPVDMEVKVAPGVVLPPVKLSRSKGTLQIGAQPPGATFELRASDGGLERSGTAPATLAGLLTGTYELTAREQGREQKQSVEIRRDETTVQQLEFAWGTVAVTSSPTGAHIYADDKLSGTAPLRIDLPPGPHRLAAKYQDWPEDTREVTVEPGKDAPIDFEFDYGSVKITSEPRGASVFLDGKEMGRTPYTADGVKPGPVSYELRMAGYKPVTVTGTVDPKEQTWLADRLVQNRGPERGKPWGNTLGMKFVPVNDSVLFCVCKTRTKDYDAFCAATGRAHDKPDFDQTEDHPVVKVSWYDAQAFCEWLTKKERDEKILDAGESYRLPTDLEWSLAVGLPDEGGGTPEQRDGKIRDIYPWGKAWPPPPGAGNYADVSARKLHVQIIEGYYDGFAQTSPVGFFPKNRLGLFDMGGDVWEWVQDSYKEGPKYKDWGVLRGASWANSSKQELLSSYRNVVDHNDSDVIYGFRCVLTFDARGDQ